MGVRQAWRSLWSTKESATGSVVSYQKLGQPVWTPRRYDQFAQEGYKRNVIAYRCINLVAKSAAAIPWLLYNGDTELETHPLLDLLNKPNPTQGGAALMRNFYGFHLISGNSYLEAVGPDNKPPRELYTLRPDRMKITPGRAGIPRGFVYTVGSQSTTWDVDEITGEGPILHLKTFNPLDDWYGLSPIEAAAYAIDQHNQAGAWNKSLLDNSGSPSGMFVYNPKEGPNTLTDEQFERLKQQIDEKVTGAKNAGKALIGEGGMDWKTISMSPKDMDWLEGKKISAVEICDAYDVPPQLVGVEGSLTFANYEQARLALYEDAVLPFMNFVVEDFNNWLAPKFGDGLRLAIDEDCIPALEPRRKEKWAKTLSASSILTINEQRAALGYDEIEGGDELMVSGAMLPLGYEPPPDTTQDPKDAKKLAYGD